MKDYGLLLRNARDAQGVTQEQAAELAGVSVDSWYAYEANRRMPPKETISRICEALDAPWLALEWLKASSEGMDVLPEGITIQGLTTAVLQLVVACNQFADRHCDRRLLEIAADGVIDAAEWPDFKDILDALDNITRCTLQVKFSRDPEKKKNRLDGGSSKRLRVPGQTENNRKIILSHLTGNARPNFAREGGASL